MTATLDIGTMIVSTPEVEGIRELPEPECLSKTLP